MGWQKKNFFNIFEFILKCSVCSVDSLNKTVVKGKIVVCDSFDEEGAIAVGAAGIVAPDYYTDVAFTYALPVSPISFSNQTDILNYLNSTRYLLKFVAKFISE